MVQLAPVSGPAQWSVEHATRSTGHARNMRCTVACEDVWQVNRQDRCRPLHRTCVCSTTSTSLCLFGHFTVLALIRGKSAKAHAFVAAVPAALTQKYGLTKLPQSCPPKIAVCKCTSEAAATSMS